MLPVNAAWKATATCSVRAGLHPLENDLAAWNVRRQLANHANLGTLEIKGDPQAWKGWPLTFAGGRYFNRSESEEGPIYRLSNANMVTKNRIGSF